MDQETQSEINHIDKDKENPKNQSSEETKKRGVKRKYDEMNGVEFNRVITYITYSEIMVD